MNDVLKRITIDPDRIQGRLSIRVLQILVSDEFRLLVASEAHLDMLRDYPYMESADIGAVFAFAAITHIILPQRSDWLTLEHLSTRSLFLNSQRSEKSPVPMYASRQ